MTTEQLPGEQEAVRKMSDAEIERTIAWFRDRLHVLFVERERREHADDAPPFGDYGPEPLYDDD